MKKIKQHMISVALLLAFSFLLVGCAPKEKIVYVREKAPVYPFKKIKDDIKGKLYVTAKTKEIQRICTPLVVEATDKLYLVIDNLEWQIDQYYEMIKKAEDDYKRAEERTK